MKRLDKAVAGAVVDLSERRIQTRSLPPPALPLGRFLPPALPADLQVMVDEGRFDDFRVAAPPLHHPDAARYAEDYRRACESADPAVIEEWVLKLAGYKGVTQGDPQRFMLQVQGIVRACRKLPADCWTEETLDLALAAFDFWPQPAKVVELLQPRADALTRRLNRLERSAKANVAGGPARMAPPRPIDPAPSWCFDKGPLAGKPPADNEQPQEEDIAATRAAELAKLAASVGLTVDQLAALPQVRR